MALLNAILIIFSCKNSHLSFEQQAAQRFEMAEVLFSQKQYQKSNEICDVLLSKGLRQPGLLHLKGLNCIHLGDFGAASEYLHQSSVHDPINEKVWLDLGFTYTHVHDFEKALEAFQNGLQINPKSSSAYNGLGVIHARLGNRQEAIKIFRLAIKHNPRDKVARGNLVELIKTVS